MDPFVENASGDLCEKMAQTFMRLYTTILNDYVRFLYKFYGQDSSISVSEVTSGGVVRIRKASSLKEIKKLLIEAYGGHSIEVTHWTFESGQNQSILIETTGFIQSKEYKTQRLFQQNIVLQREGSEYYVLSDDLVVDSTSVAEVI